jgi:hypothetical protein
VNERKKKPDKDRPMHSPTPMPTPTPVPTLTPTPTLAVLLEVAFALVADRQITRNAGSAPSEVLGLVSGIGA